MNNEQKLLAIFRNTFVELSESNDELIMSCSRGDVVSWDSGNHFVLITCIEEDFNISIPDEAIVSINSFLDAFRTIEELS